MSCSPSPDGTADVHTSDVTSPQRSVPAYLDSGRPLAFAHRGGAYHPDIEGLENTLAAFAHAVELGYTYLETDVHVTSDGVLLAFHDDRLDRVTDATGIQSLHSISHAIDFEVVQAELRDCLHLKTGATFAGPDQAGTPVLLYSPRSVDPAQFAGVDPLATADNEPDAANCLRVGNRLILPAGNPRTADRLRARGFNVVEVDVSELQKAEAGVTCMSLIA